MRKSARYEDKFVDIRRLTVTSVELKLSCSIPLCTLILSLSSLFSSMSCRCFKLDFKLNVMCKGKRDSRMRESRPKHVTAEHLGLSFAVILELDAPQTCTSTSTCTLHYHTHNNVLPVSSQLPTRRSQPPETHRLHRRVQSLHHRRRRARPRRRRSPAKCRNSYA